MYKRFSQLSFVIGLFFSIVAVILAVTALGSGGHTNLNRYTALVFLVFGMAMMFLKSKKTREP
jgi:hypothetical protein